MTTFMLIIFMFLSSPLWASQDGRYLDAGKVLFEKPVEDDVLRVNTALGYCTVLEFADKPMLVTVGDNSLIQVEIPQNSKSVVIKPLRDAGETNLFVFTPSQRFNYNLVIGDAKHMDYVLDAKESLHDKVNGDKRISLGTLLKMAKTYDFLKSNGLISDRKFIKRDLFYQCSFPKVNVDVIEAFSNKEPNYLILHIVIHNVTEKTIDLNERNTNVFVNEQKFVPQYVLFDVNQLAPSSKTDGWLVMENCFVSIDNKFSLAVGVEDEEYVCKQSVS